MLFRTVGLLATASLIEPPALRWMVSHVSVETDAAGNLKPSKLCERRGRNGLAKTSYRAKQHRSSVNLRSRPASTSHRFDDGSWREVVEVACGGVDAGVAELAGDDGDVDAFGSELGGMRVAKAVGVDALVDARSRRQPF